MSTTLLSKKITSNNIPHDFNYLNYHNGVKRKNQLVLVRSGELSRLEETTFAEIINIELSHEGGQGEYKPRVKADLPLGSEYSHIDPRWLLFHRTALKKLQY